MKIPFLFAVLLTLACCTTETGRQMDALLDRADSMNRAYIPMTDGIDSSLLEASRYYDRHGTSNEQIRAYYLLGCAYRDMGEAPAALKCYQDAVDRADTLSRGCDYKRLMSVYGQMADLFHAQNLPTDELAAFANGQKCAKRLNDTLLFIRCLELKERPYFLLHDTLSMLKVLYQAQYLYVKYGYLREAAAVYPPIIDIYISKDSLQKAKELMDIFESESNLFDKNGNISPGRENYYELKGLYYSKVQNLDSAQYYYNKLLVCGNNDAEAYKGLFSVYRQKANVDSMNKFVVLYNDAVCKERDAIQTHALRQMSSLYNYQRFLLKASNESKRASRFELYFTVSLLIMVIFLLVTVIVYIAYRNKKRTQAQETEKLRNNYADAIAKKDQLFQELDMLKENHAQLMASEQEARKNLDAIKVRNRQLMNEKEKEIADLNTKICEYSKLLIKSEKIIGNSPQFTLLIEDFHKRATRKIDTSLPSDKEWKKFIALFEQTQPKANDIIGRDHVLSPQELRGCILLLLKFSSGEIQSLLNINSQRMTNLRTSINAKLFGEQKSPTLTRNLEKIPIV